jgi:hypothetical protein
MPPRDLKMFSDDEINMLLAGDRREVDKLLLHGINNLSASLIPMVEIITELGTPDAVRKRREWVESQIENQRVKNDMMRKVSESAVIWAVIGFIGFLAVSAYNYGIEVIKTKVGMK